VDPSASALLVDLDGTLAPIVARPQDAAMIDGAREALSALRDRLGLVGFISGRGLEDLRRIVDIPGCTYVGNHGFEMQGPDGGVRIAADAQAWLPAISGLVEEWRTSLAAEPGLHVEPKGVTLSVHWRTAAEPLEAEVLLRDRLAPEAERRGLVVTWGRMVMEVRPPVAINKGTAVREVLTGGRWRGVAYVGDDRTDVDAWRALHAMRAAGELEHAIAVAVASPESPSEVIAAGDEVVQGPVEVLELLRVLTGRASSSRLE
jgi:trehalose 6-phosphate phosphatase